MLFLDVETKSGVFKGTEDEFKGLEISYLSAIDYETKKEYDIWEKEEDFALLKRLFSESNLIVGYNIVHFDMPVIANYLGEEVKKLPNLDLMVAFQKTTGFRIKLDNLARATLKRGKIGNGLDAIKYFAEGKLDELKKYCIEDVKLTIELFDYGIKTGKIKYFDLDGFEKEIDIDWSLGLGNTLGKEISKEGRLVDKKIVKQSGLF